jgi:hypothetical protein
LFEDRPVSFPTLVTDFVLKITLQILGYPIVVQQRVIHVEEKDDAERWHWKLFSVSDAYAWN